MTNIELYELIGDINETHIKGADECRKARNAVRLKLGAMAACLCLLLVCAGVIIPIYKQQDNETIDTVPAPMITIMGKDYFAPDMPVDNLPAEYRYLRDLTEAEANNTGLAGCAIYVDPQDADICSIYLYQECGTPIDGYTVDNTKRQLAYVKWVVYENPE